MSSDEIQRLMAQVESTVEERKAWSVVPYGAAQSLCPDGSIWQERHATGEWCEWTNKPWQWDFFEAGSWARQRMLSGANRVGKTFCPEVELTFHLVGDYPSWWCGYRFEDPFQAWEWAQTNEKSRDVQQKTLLGPGGGKNPGGGLLPKKRIADISFRQCGIDNVVDTIRVKWGRRQNKTSAVSFKSYDQGIRAAQGESIPWIRFDEEPDPNNAKHNGVWGECLTRLLDCDGHLVVTYTPLAGNTEILEHFSSESTGRWIASAGFWYDWTDVPHLGPEARTRHIDSIPEHERPARCRGEAKLGSGRVFHATEHDILCDPFEPPSHWFWILGHDFGLSHPAGSAKLGIDRVNDIWYLVWSYKKAQQEIPYHVATLRGQGDWIPVSWPHDGHKRQLTAIGAEELKKLYQQAGANMLPISARYRNDKGGAQSRETIIQELNNRMRTGRFKVFNTSDTLPFREEFRVYHRDDKGFIVDVKDDVISAVCYAAMMQRYAMQREPRMAPRIYTRSVAS